MTPNHAMTLGPSDKGMHALSPQSEGARPAPAACAACDGLDKASQVQSSCRLHAEICVTMSCTYNVGVAGRDYYAWQGAAKVGSLQGNQCVWVQMPV